VVKSIGKCSDAGTTVNGMSQEMIEKFGGEYVCIIRDSWMTYHKIVERRGTICNGRRLCGGLMYGVDESFCMDVGICPPNKLLVQDNFSPSPTLTFQTKFKALSSAWNSYLVSDSPDRSPISDISWSLSMPCGNLF
jgi:hypothetical protein